MKSIGTSNFIRKAVPLFLVMVVLFMCSACSSDSSEPEPVDPGYIEGPNEGVGWVGFSYPYGPVETNELSVEMGGMTFIPAAAACPDWRGDLGNSYRVTWYNDANGSSWEAQFGLNCVTIVFAWWEVPAGMILLEPGENHITITSSDGLGNVGRATMTVIRK